MNNCFVIRAFYNFEEKDINNGSGAVNNDEDKNDEENDDDKALSSLPAVIESTEAAAAKGNSHGVSYKTDAPNSNGSNK